MQILELEKACLPRALQDRNGNAKQLAGRKLLVFSLLAILHTSSAV